MEFGEFQFCVKLNLAKKMKMQRNVAMKSVFKLINEYHLKRRKTNRLESAQPILNHRQSIPCFVPISVGKILFGKEGNKI